MGRSQQEVWALEVLTCSQLSVVVSDLQRMWYGLGATLPESLCVYAYHYPALVVGDRRCNSR